MQLLRRWVVVSVALLALGACGGGDLVLPNEGQPAQVEGISGDAQTGTILEPLADSLVVKVTDRFGNPVPGIEISWSAGDGGEVRPATSVTGVNGLAATQRILGAEPGTYATTAVASVLPEDAVSFTTTAVAAKLTLTTQPPGVASSGVLLDPQPVLQLQDPGGTPLARQGVTVSVQIASGPGSLDRHHQSDHRRRRERGVYRPGDRRRPRGADPDLRRRGLCPRHEHADLDRRGRRRRWWPRPRGRGRLRRPVPPCRCGRP